MKGGKRAGAGRPPGTPNKRTTEIYAGLEATGEMPLPYMLRRMRDKQLECRVRDELAKAAAPYCHPRLASTEVSGKDGGPIEHKDATPRDLARTVLEVLRLAQTEDEK